MTPFYADDHLTVWLGDVREALAAMPDESVQSVVTSPPYYGLRDYGLSPSTWGGDPDHRHRWATTAVTTDGAGNWQQAANGEGNGRCRGDVAAARGARRGHAVTTGSCRCGAWRGQLGLEPTPGLFVEHVVDIFRAVRRVLRKDGTVWLNLGDSYATSASSRSAGGSFQGLRRAYQGGRPARARLSERAGLKAKDRMMIPARVAIALQADGWWLRDEIVWAKPNAMPSSVEDRTTPAHEMVYLLTRSARYWYDAAAIREERPANELARDARGYRTRPHGGIPEDGIPSGSSEHSGFASGRCGGSVRRPRGWNDGPTSDDRLGRYGDGKHPRGWASGPNRGHDPRLGRYEPPAGEGPPIQLGRNKRSVWTIATEPYPDAHYATFPQALVVPMILAGAPAGGVVLDPFGGSGTVSLVAEKFGRRSVYVDASAEYTEQAIRRIAGGRSSGTGPAVDMPVRFAPDGLWAEALG